MKKYIVKVEREMEINAENEEEAIGIFFDDLNLENDTLENYVIAEELIK